MRYFFALHDHAVETDDTGVELPNPVFARAEAIRFAGEVLRDDPGLLDGGSTLAVNVTDETGARHFQIEVRATPLD